MAYTLGKLLVMTLAATATKCSKTTLKNVSAEVGIPESRYTEWLKGVKIPTKEDIELICNHLEYPVTDFYEEVKKNGGSLAEIPSSTKATKPVKPAVEAPKAPEKEVKPAPATVTKVEKPTKEEDFPMPKPEPSPAPAPKKTSEKATKPVEKKPKVENEKKAPKAPVKVEKEPNTMEQSVEPVAKPKTVRSKKQPELKALTPEMESKVRKVLNLKKTDAVDNAAVAKSLETIRAEVLESLSYCEELTKTLTESFETAAEASKLDPIYVELLDAAKNASEEGITVALKILKQFKK